MTRRVAISRWILFWGLALGGAAFDLTTKSIVFEKVGAPPSTPVTVIPNVLELHTSHNPGALWGFGRNLPHSSLIFAGLSVVAGVAIVGWLFVGGAAASLPLTIALGLIMAGAMGNCYDRVMFGHVRDFVHFHIDSINFDCAIFNFADNMLVAGALTLVLFALRPDPPADPPAPAPETQAGDESEPEPAAKPHSIDAESVRAS